LRNVVNAVPRCASTLRLNHTHRAGDPYLPHIPLSFCNPPRAFLVHPRRASRTLRPVITFSLQSGSNGNAIYVEADGVRLLFDAGISGRQARLRLAEHGRDIRDVHALLLSHAHSDHTRCAGVYHRMFHIPVYATPATQRSVTPYVGRLPFHSFAPGDTLRFGDVAVHTLPTPHDADESVAFVVEYAGRRLGILTDLGHPFETLCRTLPTLDAVYLESNYDPRMLEEGWYPPELKARIRGDQGHLSNAEAAELLRGCASDRLQWAALAHLSEENNNPDVALQTHRDILGDRHPLKLASRYQVSELLSVAPAGPPAISS